MGLAIWTLLAAYFALCAALCLPVEIARDSEGEGVRSCPCGSAQTVTVSAPSFAHVGYGWAMSYMPRLATDSGLEAELLSMTEGVCSVSGSPGAYWVQFEHDGVCTLKAHNRGAVGGSGECIVAAAETLLSFEVRRSHAKRCIAAREVCCPAAAQTVTVTVPSIAVVGRSYVPVVVSSKGLAVTLTDRGGSKCSILGSPGSYSVQFDSTGNCRLLASNGGQAGAPGCLAVSAVSQNVDFDIVSAPTTKQSQSISFISTPSATETTLTSYSVAVFASSGLPVTVASTTTSVCTVSGIVVTHLLPGTCTLSASQGGDNLFNPASTVTQSYTIVKGTPLVTITTTAPISASVGGSTYTIAATVSVASLTLSYTSNTPSVCTILARVVTFVSSGTCEILVSSPVTAQYEGVSTGQNIAVSKGLQTITLSSPSINSAVWGTSSVATASSTSGLTVVVQASPVSVCISAAGLIEYLSPGSCLVTAVQVGDPSFEPATPVTKTVSVTKQTPTVSITSSAPSGPMVGTTYTPVATTSVPGGFATLSVTGGCTLASGILSFTSTANCVVSAGRTGDSLYLDAVPVTQTISPVKGAQTIQFTSPVPVDPAVNGAGSVTASSTSGLVVTFSSTTTSICTATAGGTLGFVTPGICIVAADQAGNAAYLVAATVTLSFSIGGTPQTITLTSTPPKAVVFDTFLQTATSSSGLQVSFSASFSSLSVCSVTNTGLVTYLAAGTCTVLANQAGNANGTINAAPEVSQTITVSAALQTVSFDVRSFSATVGGPFFVPAAVSSVSGLVPVISITSATICDLVGGLVSFKAVGTCVVVASQAGTPQYTAANAQISISVGQGTQSITFSTVAPAGAQVRGTPLYVPAAFSSSGLTVSLSLSASSASICTMSGGSVSFIAVGSCVVNADQGGDANYLPAPVAQQTFSVSKGVQSLAWGSTAPVDAVVAGSTYVPISTSSRSLAVDIAVDSGSSSVCLMTSGVVSFIGTGNCTLNANQPGDQNTLAAGQIQQSFPVGKGAQSLTFLSLFPVSLPVGEFYIAVAASSSSLLPVIATSTPTVCSASGGTISLFGVGTCTVVANQAGNVNYEAATQISQSFQVVKGSQTIQFTSVAPTNPRVRDTYAAAASSSVGLPVTIAVSASTATVCTIAPGNIVSFLFSGQCVLEASQPGNATYNPANQVTLTIGIALASQTITISSTANAVVGGTYVPVATATSGLAVDFSIDVLSGSFCKIKAGVVSFTKVGTCQIVANQAGNATFGTAPPVTQNIAVAKGSQVINITSTAPAAAVVRGATYTFAATSTGPVAIVLSVDPAFALICSVNNFVVSFTGAGTCRLLANQASSDDYNAAAQAVQSFAVGKGTQVAMFTTAAPSASTVRGSTYSVAASSTSPNAVTITVSGASTFVCAISGSTVSFTGAGTCVLNGNIPADTNYNAAAQVQQSFTVGQSSQTITFSSTAPAFAVFGGTSYTPTATSTSLLAVDFSIDSSSSSICSVSNGIVSFARTKVGNCVVNANQPGNINYFAAPQISQTFPVRRAVQTLTFTSVAPSATVGGTTYIVEATSDASLSVSFSTANPAVCTVSGNNPASVAFFSVGTCNITATQAGNDVYRPASLSQVFSVAKGAQVLTFVSTPSNLVAGQTYSPTVTSNAPGVIIGLSVSGTCTIAGGTVSFPSSGTCTISASQAGNGNYDPALPVSQTVNVGRAAQTITFDTTSPPTANVSGPVYVVAARSTSNLTVTIITVGSACTLSNGVVSFVAVGRCEVRASQVGDITYSTATVVVQVIDVGLGTQTVTFTSPAPTNPMVDGALYTPVAVSNRSLAVVFNTVSAAQCVMVGPWVKFLKAGSCQVRAFQAGNAFYVSASATLSINVQPGNQVVTFSSNAPGNAQVAGNTYLVTATSTSGVAVIFVASGGSCGPAVPTVSFSTPGNCTITASVAGTADYNPASNAAVQIFPVFKGTQTVSFTTSPPTTATVSGATYTVGGQSSAGLPVIIESTTTSLCTVSGSVVTFVGAGSCLLSVNQGGNLNYNPAAQVIQTVSVARGVQVVSFSPPLLVAPVVAGPTYRPVATVTPLAAGQTITFSTTNTTVCAVSSGDVSFRAAGVCTVVATPTQSNNYLPASVNQTVTVGKGSQTLRFTSTVDPVVLIGSVYLPVAVSTAPLPVTIAVSSSSAGICSINVNNVVSTTAVGVCTLIASQGGSVDYVAGTSVQQNFTVATVQFFSSPAKLFVCDSPSTCSGNVSGIFFDQFSVEVSLAAAVADAMNTQASANCSTLVWLQQCNYDYVARVLSLNAQRVANLDSVLVNSTQMNASCTTQGCRDAIALVFTLYVPILESASVVCITPTCAKYSRSVSSAQAVYTGQPNALEKEATRFDEEIAEQTRAQLYNHTNSLMQCTDDSCRSQWQPRINVSYAISGYVSRSRKLGLQVANETAFQALITDVDMQFLPCALGPCNASFFSGVLFTKRGYFAHMVQWNNRLAELRSGCSNSSAQCNNTELQRMSSVAQRSLYLMGDYLPMPAVIAGLVVFSIILAACVTIGVLAVVWRSFYGKLMFCLVLGLILLSAVFRIAFFAEALEGAERGRILFVILDKISVVFFTLAILCFVYMWAQAITIMLGESSAVTLALQISAVVFGLAIFAVVMYFAVVVSRDYISLFYFIYTVDYADIILAFITLFLALCLMALILVVMFKLRDADAEKVRTLRVIAVAVVVMVLLLMERVVFVMLNNYLPDTTLGYAVTFGVGVILPEAIVDGIMLAIVLYTFWPSRSDSSSSTGKTNSAYQSSADTGVELGDQPSKRKRYGTYLN